MGSAAARLSFGGKFCLFHANWYTVVAVAIAMKHVKTSNTMQSHVNASEVPTVSFSWET
jgi:hypothetical protein